MNMNGQLPIFVDGIPYPEGPVFDSRGNLFVCARRDGYIAKIAPDGQMFVFVETTGKPNGLAIDDHDRLYVADAFRRQILTIEPDGTLDVLISTVTQSYKLIGPNDLCFGSSGALYFTDPGLSLSEHEGAVYRYCLRTDELTCLASGLAFPNGLAVSADEKELYVAETDTSRILAVDLSCRSNFSHQVVCELGKDATPDGMEWMDRDHLVVALHGGGALEFIRTSDWSCRRVPIADGAHPTNLVLHDNCFYITEDTQQAILVLDIRQAVRLSKVRLLVRYKH